MKYDSNNAPTVIKIDSSDIVADPGTYYLTVKAAYGKVVG